MGEEKYGDEVDVDSMNLNAWVVRKEQTIHNSENSFFPLKQYRSSSVSISYKEG